MILYCRRCGRNRNGIFPACHHTGNVDITIDAARAERIRARYGIGKRFNPDHDEADYYSEPTVVVELKATLVCAAA